MKDEGLHGWRWYTQSGALLCPGLSDCTSFGAGLSSCLAPAGTPVSENMENSNEGYIKVDVFD